MKNERPDMWRLCVIISMCLLACNGGTRDTGPAHAADSATDQSDMILGKDENDPDSAATATIYSNDAFRNVTVQRSGTNTYAIQGQARIFEANVEWVVEDGHRELKKGFETASVGAPEWGYFNFVVDVKKERPNSTLTLVLFETSMKDGSRRHELIIPLEGAMPMPGALSERRCEYDNEVSTLGIGLIVAPRYFELFNDAALTERFASMDIYDEDDWYRTCPKFFKPDYGIMHFVCTDSTASSYRVLTDYSTVKYIAKTEGVKFMTWENYILSAFGIRRKNGVSDGPLPTLKHEPSAQARDVVIPEGLEMFCPIAVRNDWVRVKYDCFYNQDSNAHEGEPCHLFIDECTHSLTGWLRWKAQHQIWIDVLLMP